MARCSSENQSVRAGSIWLPNQHQNTWCNSGPTGGECADLLARSGHARDAHRLTWQQLAKSLHSHVIHAHLRRAPDGRRPMGDTGLVLRSATAGLHVPCMEGVSIDTVLSRWAARLQCSGTLKRTRQVNDLLEGLVWGEPCCVQRRPFGMGRHIPPMRLLVFSCLPSVEPPRAGVYGVESKISGWAKPMRSDAGHE